MDASVTTADPAEAMLGQLAGLDLTLARHVHACAMATEDPTEVADLVKAYQRVSRCVRQSLALQARLKRERERDQRDHPPPPPKPKRDPHRIAERQDALRVPVQRVIWAEYERPDYEDEDEDEAGYFFDLLEQRLQVRARDDAFGMVVQDGVWVEEPLDEHVVRFSRDLGLSELAALQWRDLPDPPPNALLPPEDEDEDDGDDPAHESSG